MSFHFTDMIDEEWSPETAQPPPKNRVRDFFVQEENRIRKMSSQVVEPHPENGAAATKPASGVRYYGYRYYNPVTGRWLSKDPLEEEGGLNLYAFVLNNPVNFRDSWGLYALPYPGFPGPFTPPPSSPNGPSVFDQMGGNKNINNTEWFNQNYSGWVENAKALYTAEVNDWVEANCEKSPFNGPTTRLNVYPKYGNPGATASSPRSNDPSANETLFGDKPQSRFDADKVLGSFSFDLTTPIVINYYGKKGEWNDFEWEAEMYVEDVLGLQPGDPAYNSLTAKIFPSRRAKRATWTIRGSGKCCEK